MVKRDAKNHTGLKSILRLGGVLGAILFVTGQGSAMDLKTAIEIALETNPEIGEASANRRAIDFEYQQAKQLGNPNVIIEGRAGPELIDSRTTRLFGTNDEALFARQASVVLQQNLYSFGRHDAEQDRQASRSDAAAHRVWERTEFVSLDVAQAYYDILRLREILDFSDQNVAFHQKISDDLSRGVTSGITRETDRVQAQERLSSSLISRNEVEESHDIAQAKFLQLVGQEIGTVITPPSMAAMTPNSLTAALAAARRNNPTIKIAYADLDVARAEYRAAKAEGKPELLFELDGRAGDHVGGFRDRSNDVRAQVVFRYEFRGGIRKSAVQEHINWVDEARQRVMGVERNVENLVRNAWITRTKTQARVNDLQERVTTGQKLRSDYEREFRIGNRSLLDILNSQEDLFQSQSALITAQQADKYAQYRLLAATGDLLSALGLEPRRESKANLRDVERVPLTPAADTEKRRNPHHFDKVMEMQGWTSSQDRRIASNVTPKLIAQPVETVTAVASAIEDFEATDAAPSEPVADVIVTAAVSPIVPSIDISEAEWTGSEFVPSMEQKLPEIELYSEVENAAISTVFYSDPELDDSLEPVAKSTAAIENEMPQIIENSQISTLEASNAEQLPVGVPINMVELDEFLELSNGEGVVHYTSMNALLMNNELYLLSDI